MANRERGELAWEVQDQTLVLRLTTNSCCELETFTERTSDDVIAAVNKGSFLAMRQLLWTALRDRHPDIATWDGKALEVIGDLIDQAGGRRIVLGMLRQLIALNEGDPALVPIGGAPRPPVARRVGHGVSSTLTH